MARHCLQQTHPLLSQLTIFIFSYPIHSDYNIKDEFYADSIQLS